MCTGLSTCVWELWRSHLALFLPGASFSSHNCLGEDSGSLLTDYSCLALSRKVELEEEVAPDKQDPTALDKAFSSLLRP